MKGKLIYIVLSVMLAVTIGYTSDISAYTYEGNVAVGYADEQLKEVSGGIADTSENRQNVKAEDVVSAQERTEKILKDLEPTQWEILFSSELSEISVKDGEKIWENFPTIEEDSHNEIAILCQIVEAEARGEDLQGKIMVADVILNRINAGFGDSVRQVVFSQGQFDPVESGYYYMVTPSDSTKEAVYLAITGDDLSNGSLYFCTKNGGVGYFSSFLTQSAAHGNHIFFKK